MKKAIGQMPTLALLLWLNAQDIPPDSRVVADNFF